MKKRKIRFGPLLLCGALFMVMLWLGTTYASWTDRLSVTENLTTGSMDIVFSDSDSRACRAVMVFADDTEIAELDGVTAEVSKSGKRAELTAAFPFPMSDLLVEDQEDWYIRIEFPLTKGDLGTIDHVEAYEADLSQEAQETVTMVASSVSLETEGMEQGIKLSSREAGKFGKSLTFHVWSGLEDDGGLTGVVYLQPDQESWDTILQFPEELKFSEGELPEELAEELQDEISEDDTDDESGGRSASFDASVTVNYKCTIPFFIEQGHGETITLEEAEE